MKSGIVLMTNEELCKRCCIYASDGFYNAFELLDAYENLLKKHQKLKEMLIFSIYSVDKKLAKQDFGKKYINDYRKLRLKGIRTKCKEMLKILEN